MNQHIVYDGVSLDDTLVFSRFVESRGNQKATIAAKAVAQTPARDHNPLFLYGNIGLGKTHLLHAIGNAISKNSPWLKMQYVTTEGLIDTVISAIGNDTTADLRRHFGQLDVLLIDDIQFLHGYAWTQEELFHIINDLLDNNKQIVLSSDRTPEKLSKLENGLASMLFSGLAAEIQTPDFETRLAILNARNQEYDVRICNDVLMLIARRITSSVRALESSLIKVSAHQDLLSRELYLDELDDVLPMESQTKNHIRPDIERIKQQVAEYCSVTVAEIDGATRNKKVVQARQFAIYLVRELTNCSFPKIGRVFGQRNYSTIMHAYNTVNCLLAVPIFRVQIEEIMSDL